MTNGMGDTPQLRNIPQKRNSWLAEDYHVFRLARGYDETNPLYKYVARKPFIDSTEFAGEITRSSASELAERIIEYHIKYLKNHPAMKDPSYNDGDSDVNRVEFCELRITYKAPYDIKLMNAQVYRASELSPAEKEKFIRALKVRFDEFYDSDEE